MELDVIKQTSLKPKSTALTRDRERFSFNSEREATYQCKLFDAFFSPALLFFQNGNRKIAEKKIHLTSKDLSAMAPSLSQDASVSPGALWVT